MPSFRPIPLLTCVSAAMTLALIAVPASARNDDQPLPAWASLRASEVNMRAGPGEDYAISWVYHCPHLPVRVLRAAGGWRLVQDPDGARGWVIPAFISRERSVYVIPGDPVALRAEPDTKAKLLWRLAKGVVGKLGPCDKGWCQIDVDGRKGFVTAARLWGAGEP